MNRDGSNRTDQSVAEVTGHLAGRAVNRIGIGLLRMGPVRSALRRAVAEARAETDKPPESDQAVADPVAPVSGPQSDIHPGHAPAPDAALNLTEERFHDGNQS